MSATGRLWRRAPLWRLALASAVTFVALSALFPTPSLLALFARLTAGTPWARATGAAAPTAPAVPPVIGDYPPFAATFAGTLHFAGRILPLPAGTWHELLAEREEHGTELDLMVLGRIEHGALTGAIIANASVIPADGPIQPHLPFGCFDARSAVAVPPSDGGPHDCWFTRTADLAHLERRASERLAKMSITVAPTLVATTWSRVEGGDAEIVTIAVPATARSTVRSQSAWMRLWRPLLRRGFDGKLVASDITPAASHDPV